MNTAKKQKRLLVLLPIAVISVVVVVALSSLSEKQNDSHLELERHSLIYGGDLFSARRLNYPLFDPEKKMGIISGIAKELRKADLAMVNLEGIVSTGGYYYNLGLCTYMFRAHPNLIDVMKNAGIDLVTSGNNHTPDYGPEALIEMTDRLLQAGMDYTGAGVNRADAERPVYRKVGDVVVAVVGAELTYAKRYAAGEKRPGVHYVHEAFLNDGHDKEIVRHFSRIAKEARKHAHVVIFSPHWDAHTKTPSVTEPMRRMAGELIEAGFDAILAHGRHHALGVEVINGKPVVYDAGNLLIDFGGKRFEEDMRGMLWRAEFSKAGVHRLEGIPIQLTKNRTELATGENLQKTLKRVVRLSKEYKTDIRIEGDRALVDLSPGDVRPAREPLKVLERPARMSVRYAPSDLVHEKIPGGIKQLNVLYENGIRLVGYELVAPSLIAKSKTAQTVVLYWTADKPLKDSYVVHLEARKVVDGKVLAKTIRRDLHLPGDWMLPTPYWPAGKIIQDKTNFRIITEPVGEIAFFAGLRKLDKAVKRKPDGVLIKPIEANGVQLYKDIVVPLGRTPYSKEAPLLKDAYYRWRKTRDIALSDKQPWGAPPLNWD